MKILLIQDDVESREKVVFSLESSFGAKVVESNNIKQANSQMKNEKGFDLVVLDHTAGSVQDVDVFANSLENAPFIVCAGKDANFSVGGKISALVDREILIKGLLKAITNLVESGVLSEEFDDGDFCKIRTRLLLSVCPLKGDIFIRLSESKYLKLFHQGDNFDLNDMEKYTYKKGIEFLYLKKNQTTEFIEKYNTDLQKYLKKDYFLSVNEVAEVNESIHETVAELGNRLGFTKDVQLMAKSHIRMTMKSMGKTPTLGNMLKKLESFEGKYIATHSTMTGYLACAIASHLDWGSEATFHKLTLAAFLHDITLSNHQLAACESMEEVKNGGFTTDEIRAYELHCVKAAEAAKTFSEVPPDVDQVILQHHERPDGSGFPRGLNHSYIAPLAAVFIVAHDMAREVLKKGSDFNHAQFIASLDAKYSSNLFRKVLQGLKELH